MTLSITRLQVTAWTLAAILFFLHRFDRYDQLYTLSESLISFASFIVVIYGYNYFIYPRYFKKLKFFHFILINCVFLYVISCLRIIAENLTTDAAGSLHFLFYWTRPQVAYVMTTVFIAFIIGVLLRIAINRAAEKKEAEELKRKQLETEMKLLKSQVQPHFLFNSLNNIYYEAYLEAPKTAWAIEQLSMIMRYLVDESGKEMIPLEKEVEFIKNYIELESVRFPQRPEIDLIFEGRSDVMIPPMILIPVVENFFKHGVDKREQENRAKLLLSVRGDKLVFQMENNKKRAAENKTGFGLSNLRERLNMIYKNQYELLIEENDTIFKLYLKIPVGEKYLLRDH